MHRRLHAGDARLRTLPEMTSDGPDSLRGAKQGPCTACTTADATHLPHSNVHYCPLTWEDSYTPILPDP
eukprot:815326-Pleurochrysis_carterae.AAC.1